jgi:prephenate dehydrogenase
LNRTTVGILGVGAIGGSVGLRARRNGDRVLGADSQATALKEARAVGAIDTSVSAEELARLSDVLVIATYLEPTLKTIERLAHSAPLPASLIIDVASVKLPVVQAAAELANFVATHPMAGTERSGVEAARDDLFERRAWAYVPSGDEALDRRARGFIESMGAIPLAISAEDHDRAVALTSHVPQVVASCYGTLLRAGDDSVEELCGPVAAELRRIAAMSFGMWRDILRANSANIEPHLRSLISKLESTAEALLAGDIDGLATLFGEPRRQ